MRNRPKKNIPGLDTVKQSYLMLFSCNIIEDKLPKQVNMGINIRKMTPY